MIIKYILIIFIALNSIVSADSDVYKIIQEEYKNQNLSYKFDNHVDNVIQNYKNDRSYLEKLGANNGLNVESQAKDITNKVMVGYSKDIDSFVKNILSNTVLFEKVKNNYNEYIHQGASIINNEMDNSFKDKFLDIYTSNSLKIMLKNDINEKIALSKNKILKKLEENVANGQVTLGQMAVSTIVIGSLVRSIVKRVVKKAAVRLFAKWVPGLGWVLVAYDLATVNNLYDTIGEEIKTEFHQNETFILSKISNELNDIDNISSNYKQDISDITFDFIKKSKPIYLSTKDNVKLKNKILNSDNYTYLKFSETFYQIPIEYYSYLANKFLPLSLKEMEYFHQNILKLDDIYIFDNIRYFEKKHKLNIKIDYFFDLTKLFDNFNTQSDTDTYFSIIQRLYNPTSTTYKQFLVSKSVYDVIENLDPLLQDKYISVLSTNKDIDKFNIFLSTHIKELNEFDNQDMILLNKLSLKDKEELIVSPIYYKYKMYMFIFLLLIILSVAFLFYQHSAKYHKIMASEI